MLHFVSVLQDFYIYVMALVWTSYLQDQVIWYFDDSIFREISNYVINTIKDELLVTLVSLGIIVYPAILDVNLLGRLDF
jgi:hypothetical protein